MSIVYKYRACDERAKSIILKKELWMAETPTLNDPFDCQAEYAQVFIAAIQEINASQATKLALEEAALSLMKSTRVLSLATSATNPLMWAHYAESHKGFCLGFDSAMLSILRPKEVIYQDALPKFSFRECSVGSPIESEDQLMRVIRDLDSLYEKIVLTKPPEWASESEVRITYRHPMQGNFLHFDRLSLREVVFGLKISDRDRSDIEGLLSCNDFGHVQLFQIEKIKGSFSLLKRFIGKPGQVFDDSN